MALFKSEREKYLWILASLVILAITINLFANQPLIKLFSNQGIQAAIFLFSMVLVLLTFISYGFKLRTAKREVSIILGILTVYFMLFLRLGLAERSHLIEYSILSIFLHQALFQSKIEGRKIKSPLLLSFMLALVISLLDEGIQLFLPNRVFDTNDIIFNIFAITMALGSIMLFTWLKPKFIKSHNQTNES